ncbi:ABC transporter permease [Cytobacillus sp. IB215665]|uniref:ABC transporter permease n=1 Tax=Cytobacillus sp. IB215665 TaxID=3097357 RepID=UPI002A102505|nr:ABC transporter permease [Cytobacillus sp. IB215665]MDX8365280.1 ABC transporter permease [Cytobacillus sp. IB215665]
MKAFNNILRSEWLKLRKSPIWLLIFVSPALAFITGLLTPIEIPGADWFYTLSMMTIVHALLFLPLLTGIFAAFVCRYEHVGDSWKQLLALPVSRTNVYMSKLLLVMIILLVTQLLFLIALLAVGQIRGFDHAIPWDMLLRGVLGGWIATFPLAALQIFVSIAWASFAAPLAINVIFTIPNILIIQSKYGPYYPWAQPILAMLPSGDTTFGVLNFSLVTLLFVILGSFLAFFVSGLTYFNKKAI